MRTLHLIRSAQVLPFVTVLESLNVPVRQLSERVGMPLEAVYREGGVIGEYSAWRFIDLAARQQQIDCLGYDVARQFPIDSVDGLGGLRMRQLQSLRGLLEAFIEDAASESTGCLYSLQTDGRDCWFLREPMFGKDRKNWQVEQYMIAMLIQIVRLCAGPDWNPAQIEVYSESQPQVLPAEWQRIEFHWGGDATRIRLPAGIMAQPLVEAGSPPSADPANASAPVVPAEPVFADLVRTQVLHGIPGLKNAALQTGLSEKTLKRRLNEQGTRYSEILDQQRIDIARSMLRESADSLGRISDQLGFRHPSSFTRAFKRICGETPRQFRQRALMQ